MRRCRSGEDETDSCANRSGAAGSVSDGDVRRGATTVAKSAPYGLRRGPSAAPKANTMVCAARTMPAVVGENEARTSTAASTTVVIHAANRGPRTSTWAGDEVDMRVLLLDRYRWGESNCGRSPRVDHIGEGGAHAVPGSLDGMRLRAVISSRYNNSHRGGTDRLRGVG